MYTDLSRHVAMCTYIGCKDVAMYTDFGRVIARSTDLDRDVTICN